MAGRDRRHRIESVTGANPRLLVENAQLRLLPLPAQGKETLARASDNAGFGTSEDELAVHPTNKQPHRPALNLRRRVAGHRGTRSLRESHPISCRLASRAPSWFDPRARQ